jgi:hypothetical protein
MSTRGAPNFGRVSLLGLVPVSAISNTCDVLARVLSDILFSGISGNGESLQLVSLQALILNSRSSRLTSLSLLAAKYRSGILLPIAPQSLR